jgi:transposase
MVIKSLNGNYRQEHLFALKQAYQTHTYYQEMIDDCDKQIEIILNESTKDKDDFQSEIKVKKIRAHKPKVKDIHPTLLKMTDGKDPVGIAGITDYSFLQLVSEIGSDLSDWKTEKHFVSWLKLAPLKNQSGKVNKRLNVKRANNASLLFRTIAQGILTSKHLALGLFGRRIRAKRGSGVAIKAIARKIACYYYRVMTKGKNFVEIGITRYEKIQQDQKLRYLEKLAYSMNMKVISVTI